MSEHRLAWGLYAVLWLALPWIGLPAFGQTLASQIGIAILGCLAYNLLLGQGGMLSFGHAVYGGVGGYAVVHALRWLAERGMEGGAAGPPAWASGAVGGLLVALLPLLGALAGALLAVGFGALCARHGGTAFGMITLGLGELVFALALMWPQLSGGEAGVSANRVLGAGGGFSLASQQAVLALVGLYTLAGTAVLWALTRTPLGLLLGAVRDEPERLAFLGHSPAQVRWLGLVLAGAVSGVAGGLAALQFEHVSTEVFSSQRSAALLLFVFVGGSAHFAGPILGAVLMVLSLTWLAALTPAWPLYLGLLFLWMVLRAPHGLAGLAAAGWAGLRRWQQAGRPPQPVWRALARCLPWGLIAAGGVWLVEALYRRWSG